MILFLLVNCQPSISNQIFIRANQVGFFPDDVKTAVILSNIDLYGRNYSVNDSHSKEKVFEEKLSNQTSKYGKFKYCYQIDFSKITKDGKYYLQVDNFESYPFLIGEKIYNPVRDSLILFFKVQRCGPTHPILHNPCHLSDATKRIGDNDSSAVDLTGGWHDAGDYIKFLKTTAYATYMMIFSYEFDKIKFGFDNDHNDVPDILEEAKIGLDWLLRCNFEKDKLASQVQDERDHQVGFRLPDRDTLQFDRPAFVSMGKNSIGIYVAALAIAAKIWKEKFYDDEFSKKCLKVAENIYSLKDQVPDIDTSYSKAYPEKNFEGKMALGAIELFDATKNQKYLSDAIRYGEKASSDFWWSYSDINSLAHYKIAKYKPDFSKFIFSNLKNSKLISDSSNFREGLDYSWGSTNSFLGVALQAILYKKLTASNEFDSLETYQRDYVLGRNPFGLSFIYGIGSNFPKHLHSQIAYFKNGYLPGALSAGPAPLNILNRYKINRTNFDYDEFSTDKVKYYDDYQDYITNEPTLVGNATALFVFGYLSN